jgi:3-methyladenine DNA glycosylase AlkD
VAGPDAALLAAVRDGLAAAGDPVKAPGMQAYMKSAMPFRGVQKPRRTTLLRLAFAAHPLADMPTWRATVLALWREAAYREERYAAIDLSGARRYTRWQTPDLLPLYDELVTTGAWWDYVDEVATRRIGPLLRAYPGDLTPVVRRWAADSDAWRRRSAVICQVGSKEATDLGLLADTIDANMADPNFFLRKGIGWALREQAKTDPEWVRRFVVARPQLSPLSRREALKHVG